MKRRPFLVACLALSPLPAGTPVTPEVLKDFRLPVFNEQGARAWEIRGREGRPLDARRHHITDLEVDVFRGDGAVDYRIHSAEAEVDLNLPTATGPSWLELEGPGLRLEGQDWEWQGKDNRLVLKQGVRMELAKEVIVLE